MARKSRDLSVICTEFLLPRGCLSNNSLGYLVVQRVNVAAGGRSSRYSVEWLGFGKKCLEIDFWMNNCSATSTHLASLECEILYSFRRIVVAAADVVVVV